MVNTWNKNEDWLVGIDDINFYTSDCYLPLSTMADYYGIDVKKYHDGIGQEFMAVPAIDEDVVTMAANAALPLLELQDITSITTLLFATESGVDQSKAAGVYVHSLLKLSNNCRVIELKQACYSATAALQFACALVNQNPKQKVLVIASDIARYKQQTPGEATQGCGAVAFIISQKPRLIAVNPISGCYTEDVMDFWRPNYMETALVDGKFSTVMYLKTLKQCWIAYQKNGGVQFSDISSFCYHLPFSKMG